MSVKSLLEQLDHKRQHFLDTVTKTLPTECIEGRRKRVQLVNDIRYTCIHVYIMCACSYFEWPVDQVFFSSGNQQMLVAGAARTLVVLFRFGVCFSTFEAHGGEGRLALAGPGLPDNAKALARRDREARPFHGIDRPVRRRKIDLQVFDGQDRVGHEQFASLADG